MMHVRKMINKMTTFRIAGSIALLVGAICLISWIMLMGGFARLEQKFAEKNILRANEIIEEGKSNLIVKLSDWTIWDDTYAFIENKNEAYIKSNLTETTLGILGINMMGFFNEQGECVWFMDNSHDNETNALVPEGLKQHLTKGSAFFERMRKDGSVSGIILIPEGSLLIVAKPILKSDGTGPAHGAMIFAKYINETELKRWGGIIKVGVDLQRAGDASLPADYKAAQAMFLHGKKTVIKELGSAVIAGYAPLKDVFGKESMILKVAMPREIIQFGRKVLTYFIFSLILVGLIFGLAVYIPLEKEMSGRVQAEKKQQDLMAQLESERKNLETIFDSTQVGLLLVDSKLKVKRLNQVVLDLGGKELFSVTGLQPGDALSCIHANETEEGCGGALDCKACPVRNAAKKVLATGQSVRGAVFSRKIRLATGEEKLIWLEVNASPIQIQGERHILFSLANITERKQIEDQNQESYKFLETLMDAIPSPVYFKDINGVYQGCNRMFAEAVGKDRKDIVGKTIFDIASQALAEKYRGLDLELMGHPGMQTYEGKFKFGDGRFGDVIFNKASFVGADGKVAGVIGVIIDITERKNKEEEETRRAHEYEVFYKASVGREERIIELKKQVEQLNHELEKKIRT